MTSTPLPATPSTPPPLAMIDHRAQSALRQRALRLRTAATASLPTAGKASVGGVDGTSVDYQRYLRANLVVSGTATYWCGDQAFDLEHGFLLWVPAGHTQYVLATSGDLKVAALAWESEFVQRQLSPAYGEWAMARARLYSLPSEQLKTFERLVSDLADQSPNAVTEGLGYVLQRLLQQVQLLKPGFARKTHPAIVKALELMQKSTNPVNGNAMAEESGVSYNHLRRLFRREFDLTPREANRLLCLQRFLGSQDHSLNIAEAAHNAGFRNYLQCYRTFRARFGVTPKQYVQARKDNAPDQ